MISGYQPSVTRQTILDAAFRAVYSNGFRSTSLNQILAQTGLSKGALYHHFPNKQALGQALIAQLNESVDAMFLLPLQAYENPVEGLLETIGNAFDGLSPEEIQTGCPVNNLAAEMTSVDGEFQSKLAALYQRWSDTYAAALAEGQKSGFVSTDINSFDAGSFIVGSLAGSRSLAANTGDIKHLEACRRGLEGFIESLKHRAEA